MTFLVRLTFLPLVLIGGNGLAIILVGQGYSSLWLFALVATIIGLSFLLETWLPYDVAFNVGQQDQGRDVVHALVNESLSILGVASVPVVAALIPLPTLWPTALPLWLQVVIAVVIADIGITLAHYVSHRVDLLWRLHAVHHSVKRMYGLNGLMKHPLHQTIETLAGTAPLLLLGVPQEVLVLLVVAVVLQLILQHSNVAYFTGPLKSVLVVNVVHRFHHLNRAGEGDVNFGLFTTLTDRILGTAYFDSARTFTTEDLGISSQPDYPTSYVKQLIRPFRSYRREQ